MTARRIILTSVVALGALGIAVATIAFVGANPACASTEELQAAFAQEWQAFERASKTNLQLVGISDVESRLTTWCGQNPADGVALCRQLAYGEENCLEDCESLRDCTWDIDACDECDQLWDVCVEGEH